MPPRTSAPEWPTGGAAGEMSTMGDVEAVGAESPIGGFTAVPGTGCGGAVRLRKGGFRDAPESERHRRYTI
ncbi:MAG: hypothetical protein ACLRI7_08715 [Ruthenibacterium lactatiformans]